MVNNASRRKTRSTHLEALPAVSVSRDAALFYAGEAAYSAGDNDDRGLRVRQQSFRIQWRHEYTRRTAAKAVMFTHSKASIPGCIHRYLNSSKPAPRDLSNERWLPRSRRHSNHTQELASFPPACPRHSRLVLPEQRNPRCSYTPISGAGDRSGRPRILHQFGRAAQSSGRSTASLARKPRRERLAHPRKPAQPVHRPQLLESSTICRQILAITALRTRDLNISRCRDLDSASDPFTPKDRDSAQFSTRSLTIENISDQSRMNARSQYPSNAHMAPQVGMHAAPLSKYAPKACR